MSVPMPPGTSPTAQKKPFYKQWWFITLVAVIVLVVIGQALGAGDEQSGDQSAAQSEPAAAATPSADAETVLVPDVVGMKGDAAKEAITAAGITSATLLQDETGEHSIWDAANWTVTSQEPEAGTSMAPADVVTLIVSHDTDEATPEATETPDLAKRTHDEYLNAWGVDDLSELAGDPAVTVAAPAITEWEDVSAGTIRVHVQESLSDDRAHELGRNILSLTGLQVADLDTVVVRGTDGVDVNVYSTEVPLLSQR